MDDLHNLIHYKKLSSYGKVCAFTTTRQTFRTPNPKFTGMTPALFQNNRKQLSEQLGIHPGQLVFPQQTHSNYVARVNEAPKTDFTNTDALVSNRQGLCLCVQTADCVPVLLFDPVQKAVAAIHAGWRGTVAKISEVALTKMNAFYGSLPENIIAAIGPSIGPGVYEIGDEVVEAVRKNLAFSTSVLHKITSGRVHLNLWEANRLILTTKGVKPQNIELLAECTFSDIDRYFSARKEGIETGRLVSGIMLNC